MKQLDLLHNKQPTRDDYNKLVRQINQLSKISGRNGIRAELTPGGFMITQQATSGTGGGGVSVTWAVVIRGLSRPNPLDADNPAGFSTYVVRRLTASYDEWDHSTEFIDVSYTAGDLVQYDGRIYKARIDHASLESTHPPDDGAVEFNTWWELDPPIELKFIATEAGYSQSGVDMRNWSRWYYPDDIVPIIQRSGTWYLWQTATPISEEGSLYWIDQTRRLAAVYR